jgi:error-prone DNA polymerase
MLIEDELGTVNLIVPPAVYESHRHVVRAEPLLLAQGRLERPTAGGGAINVLVRELRALALDERPPGLVTQLTPVDTRAPGGESDDDGAAEDLSAFRAVAPPVQSFASGRRR